MPDPIAGKRVLIVDDATSTRVLLRKLLDAQGFVCDEAPSGEAAVKAYHAQRPDLVTLDIHMEKLSGMGVVQVLLTMDPAARIVIVTSETEKRFIDELFRMGVKGVVHKPFESRQLHEIIAQALE